MSSPRVFDASVFPVAVSLDRMRPWEPDTTWVPSSENPIEYLLFLGFPSLLARRDVDDDDTPAPISERDRRAVRRPPDDLRAAVRFESARDFPRCIAQRERLAVACDEEFP